MDQYLILLLSACLATCLGQYPGQTSYVAPNPYLHSQDSYITAKPYAANPYPKLQTYPSKSASNQFDVSQHSYTNVKPYIDNPYPDSQAYPFNPVSNQYAVSHDSYIKANPFVGNPDTYPTGVQRYPSYTSSNSYPVSGASYPISKSNAVNDQTISDDLDLTPKQHSAFTSFNTYPNSQNSYPAVVPNLASTYISGQHTNQEPRQYPNHRISQDPYQQLNQYPDTQPNPYRQSIGTSHGSEIVNSGKGFTSLESQDGSEEYSSASGSDYYAESGSPHYSYVLKAYGYSEDPCKNGVKSYSVTGVCFAYFTCDYQRGKFGGVTWHDCGAGYRYDSRNGCVHDSSCQSACPAHIKPSSNPFKFYLDGHETYCDKGTFFDARHCTCAHYDQTVRHY